MKRTHFVASVMSKIDLPVNRLKKEINRRFGFGRNGSRRDYPALPGFENISWHFANIPVRGEIEIVFANRWNTKIRSRTVPAKTGFLATCTQSNNGTIRLAFGASLS